MELLDHLAQAGNSAGQVAQEIKLIAIVNAEVGIDMPDQNGVNRADTAFGVGEKAIDGVLALFRIVEAAIPDKQLHLRKDMLRPFEVRALVLGRVEAEESSLTISPSS